LVGLYRERTN